jgi:uncharacterized DUF497 family protein
MVQFVRLSWTDENRDHIGRHGVSPEEVDELIAGEFYMSRLRGDRFGIIGQTGGGRYLMVVVERQAGSTYAVVTARLADAAERRLYAKQVGRR